MDIGTVLAFRDRPKALGEPVHRVEVVRLDGPRRQGDAHVRFLDGAEAGLQEWVSRSQLVVVWSDVKSFLDDEKRWLAVLVPSAEVKGTAEFEAVRLILDHVRPKTLIRLRTTKADAGVAEIPSPDKVAALAGAASEALMADPLAFTDRAGILVVPWPVTRGIAHCVAERVGDEILGSALQRAEQLKARYDQARSWERDDKELRQHDSIVRVLREWCSGEDVERYDELSALRAEVERLGNLVQRATAELRRHRAHASAATIERDLGVLDATPGAAAH